MRHKASRWLLVLFGLAAVADLLFATYDLPYRWYTKPFIMIFLTILFVLECGDAKKHLLFIVALIFAWLGDTFLLFDGRSYFMLGLGSFLIMQLLYSYSFHRQTDRDAAKVHWPYLLGVLAFGIGFNALLWNYTDHVRIPVLLYAGAIALMVYTGLTRSRSLLGYQDIAIGVVLFLISDSVLSFNLFHTSTAAAGFIVMFTYITAQYLIVTGYIRSINHTS